MEQLFRILHVTSYYTVCNCFSSFMFVLFHLHVSFAFIYGHPDCWRFIDLIYHYSSSWSTFILQYIWSCLHILISCEAASHMQIWEKLTCHQVAVVFFWIWRQWRKSKPKNNDVNYPATLPWLLPAFLTVKCPDSLCFGCVVITRRSQCFSKENFAVSTVYFWKYSVAQCINACLPWIATKLCMGSTLHTEMEHPDHLLQTLKCYYME